MSVTEEYQKLTNIKSALRGFLYELKKVSAITIEDYVNYCRKIDYATNHKMIKEIGYELIDKLCAH